jgi:hypothetical protein
MNKLITIVLGLVLLSLSGCWHSNKKNQEKDDFYERLGDWDSVRIPLIKPYEALSADPVEGEPRIWSIELTSPNLRGTFYVKKVDVKDSIIFVLSGQVDNEVINEKDSVTIGGQVFSTAWYIIDTKKGKEVAFGNKKEFEEYLKKFNYPNPKWIKIDSLSEALGHGGKLPWKPKL